ncbi:hypothetical protein Bbelb_031570 [Branchiostoma belcheri]|nr:hypothetical protein Bbelb_031570 [Branchiostoma belcheri]
MSGGQQQSQTGDSGGTTPKQQPQTDWRSVADATANIPNTLYASRAADTAHDTADVNKCWCVRNKIWQITGIGFAVVILKSLHPGLPRRLGLLTDQERREPRGQLALQDRMGPCAQLALGRPCLLGLLDNQERREPRGQLAFQDRMGPWAQVALGRPGLLDNQEGREALGQLVLGLLGLLVLQDRREPRGQLALGAKGPRGLIGRPGQKGGIRPTGPQGLVGPTAFVAACPKGSYHQWRGICYKVFGTEKDFSEATAICREDGGTLATPREAETNAFLMSLFKTTTGIDGGFWIGLSDENEEGVFKWEDGTPLGAYTQLNLGRPTTVDVWFFDRPL